MVERCQTFTTNTVDIPTTAGGTLLFAAHRGRLTATIYNNSAQSIYCGPSGVKLGNSTQTGGGITIPAGGSAEIAGNLSHLAWYAISPSGTLVIGVLEGWA
jgi:hypothetical protein